MVWAARIAGKSLLVVVAGSALIGTGYLMGSRRDSPEPSPAPVSTLEPSPTPSASASPFVQLPPSRPFPCPHMATEEVKEAIRSAYQEEVGREASYAEEADWIARYRERESACAEGVPSPKTYVAQGLRGTEEASSYRIARGLMELERELRRDPTPTPTRWP